jgi:prepilin-type N-terminal cleavage/methylation domain-containing protein
MKTRRPNERGFTLVELTVTLSAFAIIAIAVLGLFSSLVRSTIVAKRQAVATTLATGQMEYLKSLPYDSLAIAGGSIYSTNPLPGTTTQTLNGVEYTIKTSINYVDDAYDGCAAYPSQALKELYCRNYPPPTGSPATDLNPQDYKIVHITVTDPGGARLAEVDTQISSRVSETASATGALFVNIIDNNGNKVSGATVTVTNTTVTPNVNVSDSSDSNGTAIFYGLPPDTGTDYIITAAKTGYSTLNTIGISGGLQPTYPNQTILTQQSSYVTLTVKLQGANSLVVEATNTSGTPLANMRVYMKGGYKQYTDAADTSYYFDNMRNSDTRPTTDSDGLASVSNLVPGQYVFCGDVGATSCTIGGTTYYLAAAVPYGGTNPFNPVEIPILDPSAPPSTTYSYNSVEYLQKVRLMLTTNSSFPRITALTPSNVSLTSGTISSFPFTVDGVNLPCSSSAASCNTTVTFRENGNDHIASCTGSSAGTELSCTVDLTGATAGTTQMIVSANGNTLTLPGSPMIGGLVVTP